MSVLQREIVALCMLTSSDEVSMHCNPAGDRLTCHKSLWEILQVILSQLHLLLAIRFLLGLLRIKRAVKTFVHQTEQAEKKSVLLISEGAINIQLSWHL